MSVSRILELDDNGKYLILKLGTKDGECIY